jgi:cytochrome P450
MSLRRLNAAAADFGAHDSMLTLDGEDHSRVRGIVAEHFLRRSAAGQDLIKTVVNEALARLDGAESFDAIEDFAARIPIRVLGPLLGCAEKDFDQLRIWTEAGQTAFDPTNSEETHQRAVDGRRGILAYFTQLIEERRAKPADDLVSDLLAAHQAGAPISENEIRHNLFALLTAGQLTTADLIGNAIYLLLANGHGGEAGLRTPAGVAGAIDETLRFEPPISVTVRFTDKPGAFAGCPYAAGDGLAVHIGAANRDPAKFAEPHKFDIARKPNPHLGFGAGAHICVGAPLARVEAQIALSSLFARFPNLRLAESGEPQWRISPGVRGLVRLDVATGKASDG